MNPAAVAPSEASHPEAAPSRHTSSATPGHSTPSPHSKEGSNTSRASKSKAPKEHEQSKKKKEKPVAKKPKKFKSVHLDLPGECPPSPILEESSIEAPGSVVERDEVHIPSSHGW